MSSASSIDVRIESDRFPADGLVVVELAGHERISRLFELDVTVFAHVDASLDPDEVVGSPVTIVFSEDGIERRRVHGMVASCRDLLRVESDARVYRLQVVPRAFRLGLVQCQEIHIDSTLREIIEKKLARVGLSGEADFSIRGRDDRREFVVQYGETDLAFLSRLAEHAGWSFHFEHSGRIVFSDHNDGFAGGAAGEVVQFRSGRDFVNTLSSATRVVPAVFAVHDYNDRTPHVDLSSSYELASGFAGGVIEYGTHHETPEEGAALARIRAEEHEARRVVYAGEANMCTLSAGSRVRITGHPHLDGELDLVVTSVDHRLTAIDREHERRLCHTSFEGVAAAVRYRPPRETPRPRLHGVVSGVVEAAPGVENERPWIDEHGRYLVRLLFDTAPPGERRASLPVRMAQPHAGAGYGVHFPLRPGTEVLVAFVGGDPDRPVIVGAVPNALTPTPVTRRESSRHRIQTSSGILLEINDGK